MEVMIPEEQYQQILSTMPVFCVDWLIRCDDQYLLLKRTQQPLKGCYWIIGGRLRHHESLGEAAHRLQTRELGRYCGLGTIAGFSNYTFDRNVAEARATHTPAISYVVDVEEQFVPTLDDTESEYIWTPRLPRDYIIQTTLVSDLKFEGMI